MGVGQPSSLPTSKGVNRVDTGKAGRSNASAVDQRMTPSSTLQGKYLSLQIPIEDHKQDYRNPSCASTQFRATAQKSMKKKTATQGF